ncbi:MAG: hypothetical protein QXV17_12010 [Candidatus Micrarchaeaceae archaeon]
MNGKTIGIIVILIALVGGAYYYFDIFKKKIVSSSTASSTQSSSSSTSSATQSSSSSTASSAVLSMPSQIPSSSLIKAQSALQQTTLTITSSSGSATTISNPTRLQILNAQQQASDQQALILKANCAKLGTCNYYSNDMISSSNPAGVTDQNFINEMYQIYCFNNPTDSICTSLPSAKETLSTPLMPDVFNGICLASRFGGSCVPPQIKGGKK